MYNFGVHCVNDSTAHMHVYDETEGGRGAASCLVKHIKENAKHCYNITLFPDSCCGQNRKICFTILKFVTDPEFTAKSIELMCMVPGHV